jgi:hypothetical protein
MASVSETVISLPKRWYVLRHSRIVNSLLAHHLYVLARAVGAMTILSKKVVTILVIMDMDVSMRHSNLLAMKCLSTNKLSWLDPATSPCNG